jgi:enoyl-CoA hydratase/carnithine racemase
MEWIMSIVLAEERNQTLLLTLNRPDARNAISSDLAELLTQHLRSVADRRDIRAIIITGAGDQAFSAGTDLKERRTLSPDQKWAQRTKGWDLNQAIWHQPQPVIAAVNGWCLGGGFELALFCDLRVASDSAVFAFPEMTLGAFPGSGAALILPRLIGPARAKQIFFTAKRVAAAEALNFGLVEWVVPPRDLLSKAFSVAEEIKRTSPLGVAGVKRVINGGTDLPFYSAMELNDAIRRPLEGTKDYEEGIQAFFEKRSPVFRGQ